MAKSGSTKVNVTPDGYIYLLFSWTAGTPNTANNYTPVNWNLKLVSTGHNAGFNSSVAKNWSVTVDGTTKSGTNTVGLSVGGTKTLASGSKNIYHNSNGDKTFNYSFSQEFGITYSGSSIGTKTGSGSGTLDTIPRGSVLGTIAGFTFGNAITIPITKYSSSFTDTLEILVGGTVVKTVSSITNNASVSFTSTELNNIYAKLPNVTSATVTFRLTTKSGSTTIGTSTKTAKGTIPSTVKPSISSVSLVEGTSGLAAAFGAYIQNKSTISGTVNASAGTGSSIETYSIKINGSIYTSKTFKTNVLKTSGTNSCVVTVTDKRGRTATSTVNFTVTAYSIPTITNFSVVRCNADGTENVEGSYAKVNGTAAITSLLSKNTKSFKLEYKLNKSSTWTTLETYTAGYTYTITNKIVPNISVDDPYDFRIVATDYFGAIPSKTISLSSAFTILDIKANGKGIAFGRVSTEDNVFDLGFLKTYLPELVYMGGQEKNDNEKNIYFTSSPNAQYKHSAKLYGGNGASDTTIGMWDSLKNLLIFRYLSDKRQFHFGSDMGLFQNNRPILIDKLFNNGQNSGTLKLNNGLMLQWGKVSITPTAANSNYNADIFFPTAYSTKPNIFIVPQTSAPNIMSWSIGQSSTRTDYFTIYLNRTTAVATSFHWFAIGYVNS